MYVLPPIDFEILGRSEIASYSSWNLTLHTVLVTGKRFAEELNKTMYKGQN